ncbi:MAG: glycosyltransferase [Candidatus Rokuibacteriota bacterium]
MSGAPSLSPEPLPAAPGSCAGGDRVRVLLVVSSLCYGGAERQVVELANTLDPQRFDVHVCSLSRYNPLGATLRDRERRLHVIEKQNKWDATVVARLVRLLRRFEIDVVQGYLFDAEIASAVAGLVARTRVVVGSERNSSHEWKRWSLVAYWLTRRCVDLVIANSHAGAAFNSRALGRDPAIYRVVHNGVDVQRFTPCDGVPVRQALGLGTGEYVVGMFASFKPQKNHALAFRVMTRLLARAPSARLLLLGDSETKQTTDGHKQQMMNLIKRLGLEQRCVVLGNRDDVEQIYPACDVTLLTSLFEGTPNVLLESMASGIPVVSTAAGDAALVAPDGEVGFVVPLGDEAALADRLCQLHGDPTLRQRLGRQARRWVEQEFTASRFAEKTGRVFSEALQARRARHAPIEAGRG